MENIKVCPSCQFPNPLSNTLCEQCKTPLLALLPARITVPVPESLIKNIPIVTDDQRRDARLVKDAIAFYMLDSDIPIVVNNDIKKISFGRTSPGETMPTVDLTPYDAHLFGVSRMHAILFRSENGCFLQDLGSTNGTWVNDRRVTPQKLYAIENGDLIRLGQLGFHAYFETVKTAYPLHLVDEIAPGQRLTPVYLDQRVSPYLIALANAQQLMDAILERPISSVNIRSIEADDNGRILIMVSGARDILRLIESSLTQWRSARMIVIDRLRALNERVKHDAAAAAEVKPLSDPLKHDLRKELADFARTCAAELAPQLEDETRAAFAEKLVIPLQALLFSPLQPTAVQKKQTAELEA